MRIEEGSPAAYSSDKHRNGSNLMAAAVSVFICISVFIPELLDLGGCKVLDCVAFS